MNKILLFLVFTISLFAGNENIQQQLNHVNKNFFIENKGQWASEVKYLAKVRGMNAWITNSGVVYDYFQIDRKYTEEQIMKMTPDKKEEFERENRIIKGHVVRMSLVDANATFVQQGKNKQDEYYNYFIGNDQSRWASFVPLYGNIELNEIYKDINLRYYFDGNSIRYDYIIKAGGDLSKLRIRFEGQESIRINDQGELVIKTCLGEVKNGKLYSYQKESEKKTEVQCRFIQNEDGTISFTASDYDRTKELVIDPLIYATYLDGGGDDYGYSLAIDAAGNAYITGETNSSHFPTTTGAYQTIGGYYYPDAFVTKLNSDGSKLIYSTFLGGGGEETGYSVAIDLIGNAYLTGYTNSSDFPRTNGAFQTTYGGYTDAFVTKLNPTGSGLVYSTFLGGSIWDCGYSVAIDASGNAYITGGTESSNFPTSPGGYQTIYGGGYYSDAFITKLNSTGKNIIYSTYIGGSGDDAGYSIAFDHSGNAYITGETRSSNFPTTPGAFQTSFGGGTNDVFVTKLNSSGSNLIYSTFLGGNNWDKGNSIAIDTSGNAYITGETRSPEFPTTPSAYQVNLAGYTNAFVTKLNATGDSLIYSTYLGGTLWDKCNSIAIDASGNAYLTGNSESPEFPITTGAFQTYNAGSIDVFITILNPSGNGIVYSTLIGGTSAEWGLSIATNKNGIVYIAGTTRGFHFPTTPGTYQTDYSGGYWGAFAAKLNITPVQLKLTFPLGGEIWKAGDTRNITWAASGITNINIQYTTNHGASWESIVNSCPASSGSYSWTVPSVSAKETWIKLSDVSDTTIYIFCRNPFRIWLPITNIQTPVIGQNSLNFGPTNITLEMNVVTSAQITVTYNEIPPQPSALPYAFSNTPFYWAISAPNTINFTNGYIKVPLSFLPGISSQCVYRWLKRQGTWEAWTDINGQITNGFLVNTIPFTSFSEFVVGIFDLTAPVELTGFTAVFNNNVVKLKWSTATETNNRGFEIQRRSSKSDFISVAFVKGNGTSTKTNDYSWSDKLQPGIYSYRLKQVDYNGKFEYSKEVEVTIIPNVFSLEQNYPNPFNPNTVISYSLPSASNVKLIVYNTLGQIVKVIEDGFKNGGNYSVNFNAVDLPSGIYFYRLEAGQFSKVKKMMLVK